MTSATLGRGRITARVPLAVQETLVLTEDLPAGQARRHSRQIPVTRGGRLASRSDMQSQGLDRLLLADAVNRARAAARAVGSAELFGDAKNEAAARIYQRHGFVPVLRQPLRPFLPLG